MTNIGISNIAKNVSGAAKTLSVLTNPNATLPVGLIEVAATGGRTYQGYKRGGETEARERICEETTSALFWLYGVKALNEAGNWFGKNILKLEGIDYDVGKDALRAPFHNLQCNKKSLTAVYKFSKIIGSVVLATSFIGFCLPKINHAITNKIRLANGLQPINEKEKTGNIFSKKNKQKENPNENALNTSSADLKKISLDSFVHKVQKNDSKDIPFKGNDVILNGLLAASHNLEHNTVWRLISTDAGIVTGRVVNSRNKIEAREFLFRDTASIYFYMFAAANTAAILNKVTQNTPIHPYALEHTKNLLCDVLNTNPINIDEFKNLIRGRDIKNALGKIEGAFDKNNVMSLDVFNKITEGRYKAKAELMSQLQPKMAEKWILSKQQVQDVLSNKITSEPVFLKKVLTDATYGAASDPKKFVSRKTVESIRNSVDDFANALIKYAKSKNIEQITPDLVKKFAKRTTRLNLLYQAAGMLVAGFGLAFLIPKLQYKMSEKATGSKEFPAMLDMQ